MKRPTSQCLCVITARSSGGCCLQHTGFGLLVTFFFRNVSARLRKITMGIGQNVKLSLVRAMKTYGGTEV